MSGLHHNLLAWITQQGRDERSAVVAAGTPAVADDGADRRLIAAVIGLSAAGVLSPVAVAWVAATNALLWRPLAASALIALLVLAPAAVAIATALAGFRRIVALATQTAGEAEHAVLRVFVATLLFGYALALTPLGDTAIECATVAAPGLVAAWALLLCVMLWPAASPLRRYGTIGFDIALLSAFLHFGGSEVAGWYPLYLIEIFYAGLRFGLGTLLATATASVAGFLVVVVSTDTWRLQPVLATGLTLALAVLPAFVAGAIRALASAAGTEADRQHALLLIAEMLRGSAAARSAQPAASPLNDDVLDFAALEAGTFAPPIETFDLRALVKHSLLPVQAKAAENGIGLRWRVEPRLPHRLRGHAQTVARILQSLAGHAVAEVHATTVLVSLDASAGDARRIDLRLRVDGLGPYRDPGLPPAAIPLALRLVQRLVATVGGVFAIDRSAGNRVRLEATLPLGIEAGAPAPVLDLGRRPVLIATEDDNLARDLAEPLAVWNAEPRWPGGADAALDELSHYGDGMRPVVIADGRGKLLSALSLAHHAARLGTAAPFVLLIAEEAQLASLGEVDEGELDGLIPLPVTERLLAHALYALPLEADRTMPSAEAAPRPPERPTAPVVAAPVAAPPQSAGERITPIAAHPKFSPEPAAAATLDMRLIDGLCALGAGPGFLREVIDTFRTDARQLTDRIAEAVAAGDTVRFARGLVALRHAAAHLGGTQLSELAASLQHITAGELHQHGAVHLQRLIAEIDRLTTALLEAVPAAEARRR